MENTILLNGILELFDEQTEQEAVAALSLNPSYKWAKIIVCDDEPNANRHRVPVEEFENILKSGINAPVKMARGHISDGHDEANGNPIGTISNLKIDGNQVKALAALWKRERPEDIELLASMEKNGTPPQVSWELWYESTESTIEGVEDLRGISLNGLSIVGMPAYQGRTPVYALASTKSEDKTLDEIEQLKAQVEDLTNQLNTSKAEVEEKETELKTLREFKASIEKDQADAEKLAGIKQKFNAAGIEKSDEYFSEHKERLLSLSEEAIDFMVQEMVSFGASLSTKTVVSSNVPVLKNVDEKITDVKSLARELKQLKIK